MHITLTSLTHTHIHTHTVEGGQAGPARDTGDRRTTPDPGHTLHCRDSGARSESEVITLITRITLIVQSLITLMTLITLIILITLMTLIT
jgi:hypothetical protein